MGFYFDHVLPRVLNLAMRNAELLPYRRRLLSLAQGRVLEIGVGSGLNLPFYTDRATEIVGLDPHPKLLSMATRTPSKFAPRMIEGSADSIPFEDRSIDTIVSTWTLCSIPNVTAALREVRRVLKADGRFLFVEHGLAPDSDSGVRRWQHRLTPMSHWICGGCNLDRPITQLVRDAGFDIASVETGYMKGPKPMTFMYEGSARPCP